MKSAAFLQELAQIAHFRRETLMEAAPPSVSRLKLKDFRADALQKDPSAGLGACGFRAAAYQTFVACGFGALGFFAILQDNLQKY